MTAPVPCSLTPNYLCSDPPGKCYRFLDRNRMRIGDTLAGSCRYCRKRPSNAPERAGVRERPSVCDSGLQSGGNRPLVVRRRWLTGEGSRERAGKGLACASCHGVCIIRLRRYCSGFVIDLFDRLCLPNAMNNEWGLVYGHLRRTIY